MQYLIGHGFLVPHRHNVSVASADFELPDKTPFVIFTPVSGKLKCTTLGGETELFDFIPGDETAVFVKVHTDASNTITSFDVKY